MENNAEKFFSDETLKLVGKIALWGVPGIFVALLTLGQDYLKNRIKDELKKEFITEIEFKEFQEKRSEWLSDQARFNKAVQDYMDDGNRLKGQFQILQEQVKELRAIRARDGVNKNNGGSK